MDRFGKIETSNIGVNTNNQIKKLIEEYHNLHKELDNKSTSFKREIRNLYYSVNGGMTLDKPKDCDICKSF